MIKYNNLIETGVSTIDTQHRSIIDFISIINDEKQRRKVFERIDLNAIKHIFVNHFQCEEDVMTRIKYNDTKNHIISHQTMLTRFGCLIGLYSEDHNNYMMIVEFLTEWVSEHLNNEDTKLALFVTGIMASRRKTMSINKIGKK